MIQVVTSVTNKSKIKIFIALPPATHNIIRIRYVLLLLNVLSPCRYVISLTAVTATNWILTVNIPKLGTLYCYWTGEEWIWKCEPLLCYHPGINLKLKVHIFPFYTISVAFLFEGTLTNTVCTLSRGTDRSVSQTHRSYELKKDKDWS